MNENVVTGVAPAGPGAVSWGAILAGAAGSAALALILLILGVGLGASTVSPWANQGVTATTFGVSTILWLTFTQLAASGVGGYLAGRLRSRWVSVHTDEVYFRDTAHGFLSWAVGVLVTAAVLTSAVTSIIGGGAQVAASVTGGVAQTAASAAGPAMANRADSGGSGMSGYFVDSLFRKDASAATTTSPMTPDSGASANAEAARIIAASIGNGSMSPEDTRYLGQLVSQRTGMAQADAEKRVTDTFTRMQAKAKDAETAARDAADKARKASAYGALWLFVSLLIGAFVASLSATYGGRRRDLV